MNTPQVKSKGSKKYGRNKDRPKDQIMSALCRKKNPITIEMYFKKNGIKYTPPTQGKRENVRSI